jgi:hypothetical protein
LLAWLTAIEANRTARFERRFEVYVDVSKYIGEWGRDGRPNLAELPMLIRAWNRSLFLYDSEITGYIRSVWIDSVSANQYSRVIFGELSGDHSQAVKDAWALTTKHCDPEAIRKAFLPHLRVYADNWLTRTTQRWLKKFWT